jgi:hypothetical protein
MSQRSLHLGWLVGIALTAGANALSRSPCGYGVAGREVNRDEEAERGDV